jgi:hypothetical protein
MIVGMKWRQLIAGGVLSIILAFSTTAQAASAGPVDETHDARTEAYQNSVQIDGSVALLWILFLFICIISMSALFKDSRRARTE